MRFDVKHADALCRADFGKRRKLVRNVMLYFGWSEPELTTPEARNVRIGGMRADGNSSLSRGAHGVAHCDGVAGVEAASDVRRRNGVEELFVAGCRRADRSLPQVSVEIYG